MFRSSLCMSFSKDIQVPAVKWEITKGGNDIPDTHMHMLRQDLHYFKTFFLFVSLLLLKLYPL